MLCQIFTAKEEASDHVTECFYLMLVCTTVEVTGTICPLYLSLCAFPEIALTGLTLGLGSLCVKDYVKKMYLNVGLL